MTVRPYRCTNKCDAALFNPNVHTHTQCWRVCIYHAVLILHHRTCTHGFSANTHTQNCSETKTYKNRISVALPPVLTNSLRKTNTHTHTQAERERVVLTELCLLTFAAFLANQPISRTAMLHMRLELSRFVCFCVFLSQPLSVCVCGYR